MSGDLVPRDQLDLDREQDLFAPLRMLQQQGVLDAVSFRTRDLSRPLTIEEAVGLAAVFTLIHRSSALWLGDLFGYSESQFGEEYAQLEAASDLSPATITDYVTTAMMVAPERRIPGLSHRHHRAIRSLPPDKQTLWLTAAVERGWSSDKLRHELVVAGETSERARESAESPVEVSCDEAEELAELRRLRREYGDEAVSAERVRQTMAARLERERRETKIEVPQSPVPTPSIDCVRLRRLCELIVGREEEWSGSSLRPATIQRLRRALGKDA